MGQMIETAGVGAEAQAAEEEIASKEYEELKRLLSEQMQLIEESLTIMYGKTDDTNKMKHLNELGALFDISTESKLQLNIKL